MTPAVAVWCSVIGLLVGSILLSLAEVVIADRTDEPSPEVGRLRSARRWLVPVLTAGLFLAIVGRFGWSWALPAYLALAAFLVVLTFIDLDTKLLPRRIVYAAGATGVVLLVIAALAMGEPGRILTGALGALAAFLVLCVLHIFARGGFGFGDVRLGAVLGWYLGWLGLPLVLHGLMASFVIGAVVGLALMVFGRAGRRTEVPFGPSLAAGALLVVLVNVPV